MTKPKPDTYERAYQDLLHYVISSMVTDIHGDDWEAEYPRLYTGTSGFVSTWDHRPARVGDLVRIGSARPSKWILGWLVETRTMPHGDTQYLIASAKDWDLCWWSNICLSFLPRDKIQQCWRWTDRQWKLVSRWDRVVRDIEGYMVRSGPIDFADDGSVTFSTRRAFVADERDNFRSTRTFPNWRKVRIADLEEFYRYALAENERHLDAKRTERERRT